MVLRGRAGKRIVETPLSAMPGTRGSAAHKSHFNTHVFGKLSISSDLLVLLGYSRGCEGRKVARIELRLTLTSCFIL